MSGRPKENRTGPEHCQYYRWSAAYALQFLCTKVRGGIDVTLPLPLSVMKRFSTKPFYFLCKVHCTGSFFTCSLAAIQTSNLCTPSELPILLVQKLPLPELKVQKLKNLQV
jgi:hypothetical protein